MLRLGDSVAHRSLGFLCQFLATRGAAAPTITHGAECAAYTLPSGSQVTSFDAIVSAVAAGTSAVPLLGGSALEKSEVVECLHIFQPPAGAATLPLLESRLDKRSYVAGPRLSVADALAVFTAAPALAALAPAALASTYPETARWLDQISHEAPALWTVDSAPPRIALPPFPTLPEVLAKFEATAAASSSGSTQGAAAAAAASPEAAQPAPAKKEKKAAAGGGGGGGAAPAAAAAEERTAISEMDFGVGVITEAWEHPESDKLWCEKVSFGEGEAVRDIASGLRAYFSKEQMVGQRVLVVRNLKSRKLAGFPSNGMVLCATGADGKVEFVVPPQGAALGERVTFAGHGGAAAEPSRVDKKKVRAVRHAHSAGRQSGGASQPHVKHT
jgi:aminoacyl tRNA synthase complex-interacting multifunctional protein 1